MSLGNEINDNITRAAGQYFSVEDAIHFIHKITGNVEVEESLDLSIVNENPAVPQSSFAFHLPRLAEESNLAGIVIMNGMTISLVGQNNNIILMDSHLHGQAGAMIATTRVEKVEELLYFVKQQLSPSFNLCYLTSVNTKETNRPS